MRSQGLQMKYAAARPRTRASTWAFALSTYSPPVVWASGWACSPAPALGNRPCSPCWHELPCATSRSSPFGSATRPIGIAHRGLVSRSDTALPVPLVGRVTEDSPSRNQPLRDVRPHCLRTVSAPMNVRRIRNSRAYGWVGLSRTHNCQVRGARVGPGPKLSR